jgi:phosphotransferase system, enzyme I, PtsP
VRAGGRRRLNLMFPMVSTVQEFDAARALLDAELEWAVRFGRDVPERLRVGAMVETPSLALSVARLRGRADFLSVGTNDLMQFFYAADRDNARVSGRYDILSPPALSLLAQMREQADAAKLPITICGEAGGRPLEVLALVALGYRRLSMQPARVAPVKQLIRSMTLSQVAPLVNDAMVSGDESVREALAKVFEQLDLKN